MIKSCQELPQKEKKKITLTQLQKFIPFFPPSSGKSLPISIKRFLASPSFSNLSILEQETISANYSIAYRNYYQIQTVVAHVEKITNYQYTSISIHKAVSNCAQKYELIDWFKFVRAVRDRNAYKVVKNDQYKNPKSIIEKITTIFHKYKKNKKKWRGIKEVEACKKVLEPKLITEFGHQVAQQVKEFMELNKIKNEKLLSEIEKQYPPKINFNEFDNILNQKFQLLLDRKKCIYYYLLFDPNNIGSFLLSQLTTSLHIVESKAIEKKELFYLTNIEQIIEKIRICMKETYYSVHEMKADYDLINQNNSFFHENTKDKEQIIFQSLYQFIDEKCKGIFSKYQITLVHQKLVFHENLVYLYNKLDSEVVEQIICKNLAKPKNKNMKQQNQVFYSFRKILLLLISRCFQKKLNKQQFSQFIVKHDATLKYQPFFAVWKLYPGVINVQNIKKATGFNQLACFLKLKITDAEYQKTRQQLLQLFSPSAEVSYSQVLEKINLQMDFILQKYKIQPLSRKQFDQVNYQSSINQIFQPQLQYELRKHIFSKVANKALSLWRARKQKLKYHQKLTQQKEKAIKIVQVTSKKGSTLKSGSSRQLLSQKSKVSIRTRKTEQSKINPESLECVQPILMNLINQLPIKIIKTQKVYHINKAEKIEICCISSEQLTFRTLTPRINYHLISGIVGLGNNISFFSNGKQQKINLTISYKPSIELIDFILFQNQIILLTSYFTLQFFHLLQISQYPSKSLEILQQPLNMTISMIEKLCFQRFHSKYPIFIKSISEKIIVNASLVCNSIIIFNGRSMNIQFKLELIQKKHVFSELTLKMFQSINIHFRKRQIISQILELITQQTLNSTALNEVFVKNSRDDIDSSLSCLSSAQLRFFCEQMLKFPPSIIACILKQNVKILKQQNIPECLKEVVQNLIQYMEENNLSLLMILQQIDREANGMVRVKSLKDFLLKVTQEAYFLNQREIDLYLKKVSHGKVISYQGICEIMTDWKLEIWERPKMVVRDFIYISDSFLLIYTIEGSKNVFALNVLDNTIFAIFSSCTSTPIITFIPERYLLLAGDHQLINVYRIYEDLIFKFDLNPPWAVSPYTQVYNLHEKSLTQITYLSNSHCLVTTSLDSTVKIWSIGSQFQLEQIKRFYSDEYYYLTAFTQKSETSLKNCLQQILLLGKVSKQINESNRYKLEFSIQGYSIEPIRVKTSVLSPIYEFPLRMKQYFLNYAYSLSKKKANLLNSKVKRLQMQISKANLMNSNIEKNLYEALKHYFIFSNKKELSQIFNYLVKKGEAHQSLKVFYKKYAMSIITQQQQYSFRSIKNDKFNDINSSEINQETSNISLPIQTYQFFWKKVLGKKIGKKIFIEDLEPIMNEYLFGVELQKCKQLLTTFQNSEQSSIKIEVFQQFFTTFDLDSEIDKLYRYLRVIKTEIRKKKWCLFSANKNELSKIYSISTRKFEQQMGKLEVSQKITDFVVSFLAKGKEILFQDFLFYLKIASESQIIYNSQISEYLESNQKKISSNLNIQQLANQKEKHEDRSHHPFSLEQKISQFERQSSLKGSIQENKSLSKSKRKRFSYKDESSSVEKSSRKSINPKKFESYLSKEDQMIKSVPISSSGSRISFSRDYTKDSFTRQCLDIIKKIRQQLKNEGKLFWEVVSRSLPLFLEDSTFTEHQFFSIFNHIQSPVKLSQKLKILSFIKKESEDFQKIDLNILFQLFQSYYIPKSQKDRKTLNWLQGEKYIIDFLVGKLTETNMSLEQAIQVFLFNEKQELSLDELLDKFSNTPFFFPKFVVRQLQVLLRSQNKSAFCDYDILSLIKNSIKKLNIPYEEKKISFMNQIISQITYRNMSLEQIFPKPENGKITSSIFYQQVSKLIPHKEKELIENQFCKIVGLIEKFVQGKNREKSSFTRGKRQDPGKRFSVRYTKKEQVKYKDFIKYIQVLIEGQKSVETAEKQSVRKFVKMLEINKITPFSFFLSLDRNKKYYLNESQFQAGLNELKISNNFWRSIKRKNLKKLYYNQFITFLIDKGMVNYKCVDSDLQIAMSKFIKKYLRNDDIETVFDRIRQKQFQNGQVTYNNFFGSLSMTKLLSDKEILYVFSAFVNSQNLKSSQFSNDDIIKDSTNIYKTFNFKNFTDTINFYKNQNITKTPHYKFVDYLKKRNISILNQFVKWMQKNKKIKEINQSLKNKQHVLPKSTFQLFVKEINAGLTEKQIKQFMASFPSNIDFSLFSQKLDQIYRKGNSNVQVEEVSYLIQKVYESIKNTKASVKRLFNDFSSEKMILKEFCQLTNFLSTGFNKIHNRMMFNSIDLEKKGYITLSEFQNSLVQAGFLFQKEEQDFQLDFILEKLLNNKDKYALRESRIPFTLERAYIIFEKILTKKETIMIYKNAQEYFNGKMNEKSMQIFMLEKEKEVKTKKDKKYKELIVNFLKLMRKMKVDSSEIYQYFSKDTGSLPKNKFLILYQSLELRVTILQINALYSFLDEQKKGFIQQTRWEEKLSMVEYEKESSNSLTSEELQVFYKVKVFLSQIYLIFVQKMFKSRQIYSYFDIRGSGSLNYEDFFSMIVQLGVNIDSEMQKRVINYLDRQRTGEILISNLIIELENCLGNKIKKIIQTKTFCIFKDKKYLFGEKFSYFIERIIEKEWFVQIDNRWNSCILQTDFFSILKDFGIYLAEDEVQDIKRNFEAPSENLLLYPIYFMFKNIFENEMKESQLTQNECTRYKKLFEAMMKNKVTIKYFEDNLTVDQFSNLLAQFKIFTPIQIKLLIESIQEPDLNSINIKLLKNNLRNCFLSNYQQQKFQSFDVLGEKDQEFLCEQFRNLINQEKAVAALKISSGKIQFETFETLLRKIDCILTKGQVKKYFDAFSKNGPFIQISDIISVQSQKEKDQNAEILFPQLLLQHIAKSLNYKQISLEQAWKKYFVNYDYINQIDFIDFLREIGFSPELQENQVMIQKFIQKYKLDNEQKQIKCSIIEKELEKYGLQQKSKRKTYDIKSKVMMAFQSKADNFLTGLQQYLKKEGINKQRIKMIELFEFSKTWINKSGASIQDEQIKFFVNSKVNKEWVGFDQLTEKMKKKEKGEKKVEKVREQEKGGLEEIEERNFLMKYDKGRENMRKTSEELKAGDGNLFRISLNLSLESICLKRQLLMMNKELGKQKVIGIEWRGEKVEKHGISLKNMSNLVIQREQQIQSKGIYLINNYYEGLSVSDKQTFERMGEAERLIHPDSTFLRTRNFYLWEPNTQTMPRGAIRCGWKFAKALCKKIGCQLHSIHKGGFCVPHLRWGHLHRQLGIHNVPFPCPLHHDGQFEMMRADLLQVNDAYCPPEVFRPCQLNIKYDSWVFGCLVYELVWGHPPKPFLPTLGQYLSARQYEHGLAQVLQMQQYPYDFTYSPFNAHQINQVLSMELKMGVNRVHDSLQANVKYFGYRGIIKCVESLYGEQIGEYQQDIETFQTLMGIIDGCLQPHPQHRLNISQVLGMLGDDIDAKLGEYIETLHRMPSNGQLYERVVHHIQEAVGRRDREQVGVLLRRLEKEMDAMFAMGTMKDCYSIPKYYPLTESMFGVPVHHHLPAIRRHFNCHMLSFLFNERVVEGLLGLGSHVEQMEWVRVFMKLFEQLSSYQTPLLAYIPNLLNMVVSWALEEEVDCSWLRDGKGRYLKQISLGEKANTIAFMKQIVYENGVGNGRYEPVAKFLAHNERYSLMFQYFYSLNKLACPSQRQMAVHFFTDRIGQQFFTLSLPYLKPELYIFSLMLSTPQLTSHCLLFFASLAQLITHVTIPLFTHNCFYLQLGHLLHDAPTQRKREIIHLVLELMRGGMQYCRAMSENAYQLMAQIGKLLIQPGPATTAHRQFVELQPLLRQFLEIVTSSSELCEMLSEIPVIAFALTQ